MFTGSCNLTCEQVLEFGFTGLLFACILSSLGRLESCSYAGLFVFGQAGLEVFLVWAHRFAIGSELLRSCSFGKHCLLTGLCLFELQFMQGALIAGLPFVRQACVLVVFRFL